MTEPPLGRWVVYFGETSRSWVAIRWGFVHTYRRFDDHAAAIEYADEQARTTAHLETCS